MEGWVKTYRALEDWAWWDDPVMVKVWMMMLFRASTEDRTWRGINIKRGQFVMGRLELASKANCTEQQIRTIIKRLKSTNELTITSTNKYSVATIVKYDLYQSNEIEINQHSNQLANKRTTNKQPTNNQQITTVEEIKNIRNKEIKNNNVDLFFDSVWVLYPKKEGKGNVSQTQRKKLLEIGYEKMKICIERYCKVKEDTDMKYWKNGSTFFNSGYIDYLNEPEPIEKKPSDNYDPAIKISKAPKAITREMVRRMQNGETLEEIMSSMEPEAEHDER